jgi:hypothetical protein
VLKSYSIKVNGYDRISGTTKAKYFNVWAKPNLKIKDSISVSTTFENNPDSVEYYIDSVKATN